MLDFGSERVGRPRCLSTIRTVAPDEDSRDEAVRPVRLSKGLVELAPLVGRLERELRAFLVPLARVAAILGMTGQEGVGGSGVQ